jgi:hypothetical protein
MIWGLAFSIKKGVVEGKEGVTGLLLWRPVSRGGTSCETLREDTMLKEMHLHPCRKSLSCLLLWQKAWWIEMDVLVIGLR